MKGAIEPPNAISAMSPLLRHRALRVLLVAGPGIMGAIAILTAGESNLAVAIALNAGAGVVMSTAMFVAVSIVARRVADERVGLAQAAEQGFWRARTQLVAIYNDDTGLFADWYFRLRLQEEVERARRFDGKFAVVLIKALGMHQEAKVQASGGNWLGDKVRRHLRTSDLVAMLHDGTIALLLPNTAKRGAQTARRRLQTELAEVRAEVGLACYPQDGEEPIGLLRAANPTAPPPAPAAETLTA